MARLKGLLYWLRNKLRAEACGQRQAGQNLDFTCICKPLFFHCTQTVHSGRSGVRLYYGFGLSSQRRGERGEWNKAYDQMAERPLCGAKEALAST